MKKGMRLQLTVFFEDIFDNPRIFSRNARILIVLVENPTCKLSYSIRKAKTRQEMQRTA